MSLLASSFLDTRSTRAAVVLALVLHVAVMYGLVQYSRTGHSVMTPHTNQDAYQAIKVVFVAAAVAPVLSTARVPVPQPVRRAHLPLQSQPAVQALAQTTPAAQTSKEAVAVATPAVAPTTTPTATPVASIRTEDAHPQVPPIQAGKPDYAYNPQPDYPMLLREQGVGGVVWLRVWVGSDGHPGEITLAKGSGYRLLDDAALRAVRQWRFVPAQQGAHSLASWVEFPIRFTVNG